MGHSLSVTVVEWKPTRVHPNLSVGQLGHIGLQQIEWEPVIGARQSHTTNEKNSQDDVREGRREVHHLSCHFDSWKKKSKTNWKAGVVDRMQIAENVRIRMQQ